MSAKAVAQLIEPAAGHGLDQFKRSDRPPCPAAPIEPGVTREIMAARQGHRGGRLDAGFQPDSRAGTKSLRGILCRKRNPEPGIVPRRRQRQPHIVPRDELLDALDARVDSGDRRPLQPRRRDPRAPPPDERASRRQRQPGEQKRAAKPPLPRPESTEGNPADGHAEREHDEGAPLRWAGQP